jgi:hypothetical protein
VELLAKLSFQVGACQGDTGGGNQRIPGSAGKGMVPLLAKLWFKSQSSSRRVTSPIVLRNGKDSLATDAAVAGDIGIETSPVIASAAGSRP